MGLIRLKQIYQTTQTQPKLGPKVKYLEQL